MSIRTLNPVLSDEKGLIEDDAHLLNESTSEQVDKMLTASRNTPMFCNKTRTQPRNICEQS